MPRRRSGLSPHMRGNLRDPVLAQSLLGSIPAHAGEPGFRPANHAGKRVYPRTCGGTIAIRIYRMSLSGLSPHMRGNLILYILIAIHLRSIPAHAGEPNTWAVEGKAYRVYPRTCGGTPIPRELALTGIGLSPHMRGNLEASQWEENSFGSIPAHAGEPGSCPAVDSSCQVYPRTCGGTIAGRWKST